MKTFGYLALTLLAVSVAPLAQARHHHHDIAYEVPSQYEVDRAIAIQQAVHDRDRAIAGAIAHERVKDAIIGHEIRKAAIIDHIERERARHLMR